MLISIFRKKTFLPFDVSLLPVMFIDENLLSKVYKEAGRDIVSVHCGEEACIDSVRVHSLINDREGLDITLST